MSISTLKSDNLVKLLGGLSSLGSRDQEQIISIVDALGFASKKMKKSIRGRLCGTTASKNPTAYMRKDTVHREY